MSIDIIGLKRQNASMEPISDDPKQNAILTSAWDAFANYGFRKTSMDDIARGAGMSRPALYLYYKNKEDIFRSLSQFHYDLAASNVAEALGGQGPVEDVLAAAFMAQYDKIVEAMMSSPHGAELMDTGFKACADIAEIGENRFAVLYGEWLESAAQTGRVRLLGDAMQMALTMTGALKGLKMTAPDYPEFQARVRMLARLMARGLSTG